MEIIIQENEEQAAKLAAREIRALLLKKPAAVLGLATGSSPVGVYRELIRYHREEGLSFGQATSFNLDEYLGLPPGHPASYATFMQEQLFREIDLPAEGINIPSCAPSEVEVFCEAYDARIAAAGGIDLQILGIGHDGHIGFNEPSSSLGSRTRIKTLTAETRRANARFFSSEDEVPPHVVTMGIANIMEAREIILLAFGRGKAAAIAAAVEGPITASCPASMLQFHRRVKVFIDEEAAGALQRQDYYRWVYEHKPGWQRA